MAATAAIATTTTFAEAGQARAGRELLALSDLLPDPTIIHPDIAAGVSVDLSGIGPIAERLSQARADVIDASSRELAARARLGSLDVARDLNDAQRRVAQSEEGMAMAAAEQSRRELGAFAVDSFVAGERDSFAELRMQGNIDPRDTLVGDVGDLLGGIADAAAVELTNVTSRRQALEDAAQALEEQHLSVESARVAALTDLAEATVRVDDYGPAFELALMTAPVRGVDFPVVVLDAYYRAELTEARERPACRVHWQQLAAIGRVESGHGTFRGSSVGADGTTTQQILGPVLDGSRFSSIPDTDGGAYDGDPLWDRAVGPMQFIPSSWKLFGRDGNGDGIADPHNLYDAALGAAEHLCRSHSGLDQPDRYRAALLGYNRSVRYGQMVMGYAEGYRSAVRLSPSRDSVRALVRAPGA